MVIIAGHRSSKSRFGANKKIRVFESGFNSNFSLIQQLNLEMVESECILGNIQDSAGSLPSPYQQCLRNDSVKTGSHTAAYGVFCREKTTSLGAKGLYLSSLFKNGICCFLGDPSFASSSLSSNHIGRDGKGSPF